LLRIRSNTATGPTGPSRSLLYLLHLHYSSQHKSSTPRFTRRDTLRCLPIPSCLMAAPPSCVEPYHVCCRAHSALSRRARSPPHVSCLVPQHIEVLPTSLFPSGGRGCCRRWRCCDAQPQFATSQDPKRASLAAPRAPFLPWMLQVYVSGVLQVFMWMLQMLQWLYTMLQASILNVLANSDRCCTCFIWVLHMVHTYVVSNLCCK
jgi:hypothetical protein